MTYSGGDSASASLSGTCTDVAGNTSAPASVALKYESGSTAPIVVAKGVDNLAFKIREAAKDAGVMIVPDPPLARTRDVLRFLRRALRHSWPIVAGCVRE